jgi:hypothetical protein
VRRFLPASATLVSLTGLLLLQGSTRWSWVAGPVAALAIRALDYEPQSRRETVSPALRPLSAEPEPVD